MKPVTETERRTVGNTLHEPHPDGQPWTKCCRGRNDDDYSCQCFMKKPRCAPSRRDSINYELIPKLIEEGGRFFCVHRETDDGFNRECAGWAAKYGKERTNEAATETIA